MKYDIQDLLDRIRNILQDNDENRWAEIFSSIQKEMVVDPVGAGSRIRSLFGGMGSLNDIVLSRHGLPLIEENDQLSSLRRQLFDLIHARRGR